MAVPTSYLVGTKNLNDILTAIQKAGVPTKFTYEFLKKLGFPSSNDRPIIPVFKSMRFLDGTGVPLDRYRRFRDQGQAAAVMAEGMREAYVDVFSVDQKPQDLSTEELKGIFARLSGKSDSVTEKMAMTFKALAAHADFSAPPAVEETPEEAEQQLDEEERRELVESIPHRERATLRLHHDIHVHLPESDKIEVHDAIFRALRQNFGE